MRYSNSVPFLISDIDHLTSLYRRSDDLALFEAHDALWIILKYYWRSRSSNLSQTCDASVLLSLKQ